MTRLRSLPLVVVVGLSLVACGKKEGGETQSTQQQAAHDIPPAMTGSAPPAAPANPTSVASTTSAEANVDVSPEMRDFMNMLDGTTAGVTKALKKHASTANQHSELASYTLKDPKVVKAEKSGSNQCYTMVSTAGSTKRATRLCWDGSGKISQIDDKMLPAGAAMP